MTLSTIEILALDLLREAVAPEPDTVRLEVCLGLGERHPGRVPEVPLEAHPAFRLRKARQALRQADGGADADVAGDLGGVSRRGWPLDPDVAQRELDPSRVGDVERAARRGIRGGVEIEKPGRVEAAHEHAPWVDAEPRVDRAEVIVVDAHPVLARLPDDGLARPHGELEARARVRVVLGGHVHIQIDRSNVDPIHLRVHAGAVDGDDVERSVERAGSRFGGGVVVVVEVVDLPVVHHEPYHRRGHLDLGDRELARQQREKARTDGDQGRHERRVLTVVGLDAEVPHLDCRWPEGHAHVEARDDVLAPQDALGLLGRPCAHPGRPHDPAEHHRQEPNDREEGAEHLRDDRPPIAASMGHPRGGELAFEVESHRAVETAGAHLDGRGASTVNGWLI